MQKESPPVGGAILVCLLQPDCHGALKSTLDPAALRPCLWTGLPLIAVMFTSFLLLQILKHSDLPCGITPRANSRFHVDSHRRVREQPVLIVVHIEHDVRCTNFIGLLKVPIGGMLFLPCTEDQS